MSQILLQCTTAFFATLAAINFLARLAPKLGLEDTPSSRKQHVGNIPTVGGIAIFCTLLLGSLIWGGDNVSLITVRGEDAQWQLLGCAALLVLTGALDDRFNLGIAVRIGSEVLISLLVIDLLNLRLEFPGDLFGAGEIRLPGITASAFTVLVIFGMINAFNMLDGMDGLLASLVLSTLCVFHVVTEAAPGVVSMFVASSLLAFLVSNLSLSPLIAKTFLGDAGSRLLGFIVVCLLLSAATEQVGGTEIIKPVTALFLVALPLFDMVFTAVSRIARNTSPFIADRTHVHHLLRQLGFSGRRTLAIIVLINLALNLIGLILHHSSAADYYQLAIFLTCFALYSLLASQGWLLARRLQ